MLKAAASSPPPFKEQLLARLTKFLAETSILEIISVRNLSNLKDIVTISKINNWLAEKDLTSLIRFLIELINKRRTLIFQNEQNPAYQAYTYCIYKVLLEIACTNDLYGKLEQLTSHFKKEELDSIKGELDFVAKFRKIDSYTLSRSHLDVVHTYYHFLTDHTSNRNIWILQTIENQETIIYQIEVLKKYIRNLIDLGINPSHTVVNASRLIEDDLEVVDTTPSKSLEIDISKKSPYLNGEPYFQIPHMIGKILGENIRDITILYNPNKLSADDLFLLQRYMACVISSILLYTPIHSITISNVSNFQALTIEIFLQDIMQFLKYNKSITNFQINGHPAPHEIRSITSANLFRQHMQARERDCIARVKSMCLEKDSLEDIYKTLTTQNFLPIAFCVAWALKNPDDKLLSVFKDNLALIGSNQETMDHFYKALIKRTEGLINDETRTFSDVCQYLGGMHLNDSVPYCIDELYCAAWVKKNHAFQNDKANPSEFLLHLEHATQKLLQDAANLAKRNSVKLHDCVQSFEDICNYFCAYPALTSDFAFKTLFPLIKDTAHPLHTVATQTLRRLVSTKGQLEESPEQKLYRHARLIIVDQHVQLDDEHEISDWIRIYIRDCSGSELSDTIQTLADIRAQFPEHYLKLQMAVLEEKRRLMATDDDIANTRLEILETSVILKKKKGLSLTSDALKEVLGEDLDKRTTLFREMTDLTRLPMFYKLKQAVSDVNDAKKNDLPETHPRAKAATTELINSRAEFNNFMQRRKELELNNASLILNSAGKCTLTELATNGEWELLSQLATLTDLELDLESDLFSNLLSKCNFTSEPSLEAFRVLISQAETPSPKTTTTRDELPVISKKSVLAMCLPEDRKCKIFRMLVAKGLDPNIEFSPGKSLLLFALSDKAYEEHAYALLEASPVKVQIPSANDLPNTFSNDNFGRDRNNPRIFAGLLSHGFDPTSIFNPQPADEMLWRICPDTFAAAHQVACATWKHLRPKMQALEDENAKLGDENTRLRRELAELKQRNSPGLFKGVVSGTSDTGAEDQKERACLPSLPVTLSDQPGCSDNVRP